MKRLKDLRTAFPPAPASQEVLALRERARRNGHPIVSCHTAADAPYKSQSPEWGTWNFWCEACRTEHTHGAGEGLRRSHCTVADSPLAGCDYYLVHHTQADIPT